jgi:hypothetical protein
MGYEFLGERVQELKHIPAEQRRSSFLRAVKKPYGHFSTWLGLFIFLALSYLGATYGKEFNQQVREFFASSERSEMFLSVATTWVGMFVLYHFQMKVIKGELLKQISSQPSAGGDGIPPPQP